MNNAPATFLLLFVLMGCSAPVEPFAGDTGHQEADSATPGNDDASSPQEDAGSHLDAHVDAGMALDSSTPGDAFVPTDAGMPSTDARIADSGRGCEYPEYHPHLCSTDTECGEDMICVAHTAASGGFCSYQRTCLQTCDQDTDPTCPTGFVCTRFGGGTPDRCLEPED